MSSLEEFDINMAGGALKAVAKKKGATKKKVSVTKKKVVAKKKLGTKKVVGMKKVTTKKKVLGTKKKAGTKKKKAGTTKKAGPTLTQALRAASGSKTPGGRAAKAKTLCKVIAAVIRHDYNRTRNKTKYRVSPIKTRIGVIVRGAKASVRTTSSRQNLVAVLSKAATLARRNKTKLKASGKPIQRKIASAMYSVLSTQASLSARLKTTGCRVPRCVKSKYKGKSTCACPNVHSAFVKYYKAKHPKMSTKSINAAYKAAKTTDIQRFKNSRIAVDGCTHNPKRLCKIMGRPPRRTAKKVRIGSKK
jgi:hypothetical protein